MSGEFSLFLGTVLITGGLGYLVLRMLIARIEKEILLTGTCAIPIVKGYQSYVTQQQQREDATSQSRENDLAKNEILGNILRSVINNKIGSAVIRQMAKEKHMIGSPINISINHVDASGAMATVTTISLNEVLEKKWSTPDKITWYQEGMLIECRIIKFPASRSGSVTIVSRSTRPMGKELT